MGERARNKKFDSHSPTFKLETTIACVFLVIFLVFSPLNAELSSRDMDLGTFNLRCIRFFKKEIVQLGGALDL